MAFMITKAEDTGVEPMKPGLKCLFEIIECASGDNLERRGVM